MINPNCSKCESPLEITRLFKQRYCKACHAEHMRNNRPKHSELPEPARKKANARSYLHVYVKRGKIIKAPCEICGSERSEAHHIDYTKPLEVHWLCRDHHLELHQAMKSNQKKQLPSQIAP
jgi:hypothetical protein